MKEVYCPICKHFPTIEAPFKTLNVDDVELYVCCNCGIVFSVIDDLDDVVPEKKC